MIEPQPDERDLGADLGIAKMEIEELRKALAEEQEKAKTSLANWQRAQADYVNYKRQAQFEKDEVTKYSNTGLVMAILPFLDDLERALASLPSDMATAKWVDGIRMMERKLLTNLESQGVSVIKSLGEPFDPHVHEAVKQAPGKEGIVIEEIQRGYKLRDRVLRPSLVAIGNGEAQTGRDLEP